MDSFGSEGVATDDVSLEVYKNVNHGQEQNRDNGYAVVTSKSGQYDVFFPPSIDETPSTGSLPEVKSNVNQETDVRQTSKERHLSDNSTGSEGCVEEEGDRDGKTIALVTSMSVKDLRSKTRVEQSNEPQMAIFPQSSPIAEQRHTAKNRRESDSSVRAYEESLSYGSTEALVVNASDQETCQKIRPLEQRLYLLEFNSTRDENTTGSNHVDSDYTRPIVRGETNVFGLESDEIPVALAQLDLDEQDDGGL